MKQTKKFRKLMSFVLVVTMLLSVTVVGIAGVSAENALAISYDYKYLNAGYAEGRVTLFGSAEDYGTYYFYWADDTKALEGYAPIISVNLNQDSKSFNMGEFTAIPADATKLIAIKSDTVPATTTVAAASAVYDIPESKQFGYSASDMQYNFQALSDVHVDSGGFYAYAEQNLTAALNAAAQRDAELVTIAGDLMNGNNGANNFEKEWGMYLAAIAASDFTGPIYEVNGNHETYNNGGNATDPYKYGLDLYSVATGLGVDTEAVPEEPYYEVTGPNGDHFIFMTMEYITKTESPNVSNCFTDAQMDWLEALVESYKGDGKKIFINQHAPFGGYGAGDNKETPHYAAAMTIDEETYPNVYRFKELLEANKDIIWFNGHTHIDFKYNYNIDNENGTTAYTVHIPSTASPTLVNSSGTLDYPQSPETSQGYFVDVFDKAVVLNGTDLINNEVLPRYTYLIDYSGEQVTLNPDYTEETESYDTVTVVLDASVISQNPDSVKISLFGADDETDTSTITMAKGVDGTYTAQVSTKYTKMRFVIKSGSSEVKSSDYTVANCKVVLGGLKIAVSLSDIKTKTNASCTAWTAVNAYAWNSDSGSNCGAWPGTAMTKESDGTYSVLLPEEVNPDMIIFNNSPGTAQTADLSITPFIVSSVEGSYTEDSSIVAPETEAPTPTETTAPVETIRIYLNKPSTWAGAYIYGFYGVEGGTATGEPLGTYPGTAMISVDGDVYYYDVPEDIDYIKFADGSTTNRRTNNFPNTDFSDNVIFTLTSIGSNKWDGTAAAYTEAKSVASVGATRLLYGDADQNSTVNVKDATAIQKHIADIISLSEYGYMVADVDADEKVNVKDATTIQKFVASIINEFPSGKELVIDDEPTEPSTTIGTDPVETSTAVETDPVESSTPAETDPVESSTSAETDPVETTTTVVAGDPTQLNALLATVKKTLSDETYYASYVAYAGLKKAYYNYKDADTSVMSEQALADAVAEINEALANYNTMKKNNPNHIGAYVAPTAGSYVIHGNFTGSWGDLELEPDTGNTVTATLDIAAGSYEFVMNKVGTDVWLKNGGTINDTCSNLKYSTSQTSNTKFVATGGTYTFSFNTSTLALTITKK